MTGLGLKLPHGPHRRPMGGFAAFPSPEASSEARADHGKMPAPCSTGFFGCCARRCVGAKKIVRLASVFPSPPFRSSDFAGPRRPRLYGFHWHSEPFESEGTRAAKRYVNGNLGFRNLLGARRGLRGQFSVQSE